VGKDRFLWSRLGFTNVVWLAMLLAPGVGWAADFFFLQMSDPQFGMYTANGEFSQETANFEFAIANANRMRPAFVVVCGDLINRPADPAQTAEYLRIAGKLDPSIKLYNVPGNHDVRDEPTPESLAAYRQKFGSDYYSFRYQDFAGLVIDSSLIQHPGKAPEEAAQQEQWIAAELEKVRREGAKRIAVFEHIPWFLENPDEPDQYFNLPREARQRFLPLFQRYGADYAFAGHYHRNAYAEAAPSFHVITTGPVGKPLGIDPSGIRVVIVREATMESRYYGLGNIPNQVELSSHGSLPNGR
jgi:3',5'-cyclic AMP phosphodiesterase CpdA